VNWLSVELLVEFNSGSDHIQDQRESLAVGAFTARSRLFFSNILLERLSLPELNMAERQKWMLLLYALWVETTPRKNSILHLILWYQKLRLTDISPPCSSTSVGS